MALIKMPARPAARSFLQRLPSLVLKRTRRGHCSSSSSPSPPPTEPPPVPTPRSTTSHDSTLSATPSVSWPVASFQRAGTAPSTSAAKVALGAAVEVDAASPPPPLPPPCVGASAERDDAATEREEAATALFLRETASSRSATWAKNKK